MHPKDLKYSKEHEWAKVQGQNALVGITFHAQDELGDVVYVELPRVGQDLKQFQEFGVVESVKTVSSLYSPLSGKVEEINTELESQPELINTEPYQKGWLMKLRLSDPSEADKLLSAEAYEDLIKKGK
jgi:glycine cleavage system H protein